MANKIHKGLCWQNPCLTLTGVNPATAPEPEPTCSDYTVEWVVFNPGVFGGTALIATLNGVDLSQNTADVVSQLQAVMSNWEGKTNVQVSFNPDSSGDFFYIGLTRLTSEGAFTNFGEYINLFDPTPQTVVPVESNCYLQTFRAEFTVNDAALTLLTGLTVNSQVMDLTLGGIFLGNFATAVTQDYEDDINQYFIFETGYTILVTVNGNDITIDLTTITIPDSGTWGPWDTGGDSGNFNFVLI